MIEIPTDKINIGQPRNDEWHALAGRENRYPNQFGDATEMVVETELHPEETAQLKGRGVVFPLETAEPVRTIILGKDMHI